MDVLLFQVLTRRLPAHLADVGTDSILADFPYGNSTLFEDKEIAQSIELWKAILRVAKPGSHLIDFE
jgi:hypothetical protein